MGGEIRISGAALELPGGVTVRFMRTLRLPESGTHQLPPGLGSFPLRSVADYQDRAPARWLRNGGVLLPVHRREAVWLSLSSTAPAALQVGVGKVCAVSGQPWSDRLSQDPQNYVVLPRQPWLDGVNSGRGTIRQFVAVPREPGAVADPGAADEQAWGEEVWGGVRLQVFELRQELLDAWLAARAPGAAVPGHGGWGSLPGRAGGSSPFHPESGEYGAQPASGYTPLPAPGAGPGPAPPSRAGTGPLSPAREAAPVTAIGLGAGGRMRQALYRDERPPGDWREQPSGRVFVHLATIPQWRDITGEPAPASPVTRAAYVTAGLPWFDSYDADGAEPSAPEEARGGDGASEFSGSGSGSGGGPGRPRVRAGPCGPAPPPDRVLGATAAAG